VTSILFDVTLAFARQSSHFPLTPSLLAFRLPVSIINTTFFPFVLIALFRTLFDGPLSHRRTTLVLKTRRRLRLFLDFDEHP